MIFNKKIYPPLKRIQEKKTTTQTTYFSEIIQVAQQIMLAIMIKKKMIVRLFKNNKLLNLEESYEGNNTNEFDDSLLRQLQICVFDDKTILFIQIQIISPHQEILTSQNRIDLIFNYKLSQLNSNNHDIIFYTDMDQIMVKNQIYLPSLITLSQMKKEELNEIISQVLSKYDEIEQTIMQQKDKLFSLLELDNFYIEIYFQDHLPSFKKFQNDNDKPQIENEQKITIVFARKCEFNNDQISVENENYLNKQNLNQKEQNIINNLQNPLLQQNQFQVNVYCIELKAPQQTNNLLIKALDGQLLQEFLKTQTFQENTNEFEINQNQIYVPEEDPNQKNVLKEKLPEIQISVQKKIQILQDVILIISNQQQLLQNSNFKGKLSVISMIRFCNELGARPIIIMKKKEKKLIDIEENRKHCNIIIKNFINVLFFSDEYQSKVKPIEDICGEFLRNLSQCKDFPDYFEIQIKLEKLIYFINQIYCVNL
ncbi:unnamed protein product [Paramecium sonneborni]|uniref:Uncharacterized protein n=1 Tax=Paramecium sonneborni TaxID=65129 RepID=A0A8S1N1P7_9CILI|nr:unnamed protein product [Paramecium sonneborni]